MTYQLKLKSVYSKQSQLLYLHNYPNLFTSYATSMSKSCHQFFVRILHILSQDAEMVELTKTLTSAGQHSIAFMAREYLINLKSI